nr:uracil-DNA glycosylase [Actinotalea subterranea]
MPRLPLDQIMAPDWAAALAPVEPRLRTIGDLLRAETAAGHRYLPAPDAVLRAFARPMAEVRVLVVGQDPYPTPGHAVGLSFCVAPDVRPLPRSLQNIYRELADDVGCSPGPSGDLTGWAEQGVLLLNRVLTVREGSPASHRSLGWQEVTDRAVAALVERGGPLVAVLWGRDAQELRPALHGVPLVQSVHPSPLSAARGFFGSKPFSRVNALLAEQGAPPVDWARHAGTGAGAVALEPPAGADQPTPGAPTGAAPSPRSGTTSVG